MFTTHAHTLSLEAMPHTDDFFFDDLMSAFPLLDGDAALAPATPTKTTMTVVDIELAPLFEAMYDDDTSAFELLVDLVDLDLTLDAQSIDMTRPAVSHPAWRASDVAPTTDTNKSLASPPRARVCKRESLADSPCSPSSSSLRSSRKPKQSLKRKPAKTTSQRQREEIAHLIKEAASLEHELARIKATRRRIDDSACSHNGMEAIRVWSSLQHDQPSPHSLWEGIAKRQLEAKQRAQGENAALRREVQATLRTAKSLERSLHKRQRVE